MTYNPKHRIFKENGVWYLVRKSFGFSPHITVTTHPSLQACIMHAGGDGGGHASTILTFNPTSQWIKRYDNYPMRIE